MSMIDISKKLSNDKPVIKIAEGKEYKINNSHNYNRNSIYNNFGCTC